MSIVDLGVGQIETRTLDEVREVLNYASENKETSLTRIMLDNMVVPLPNGDVDVSMLQKAIQLINGKFETEVCVQTTYESKLLKCLTFNFLAMFLIFRHLGMLPLKLSIKSDKPV